MQLFLKSMLSIIGIATIVLLGCSGPESDKPIENQPVQEKPNPTEIPVVSQPPSDAELAQPTVSLNVSGLEPSIDPTLAWDDVNDSNFPELREVYVLQHIRKPENIPWALQNPLSKRVAYFLEKGYGIYWPAISKQPKEVELGFICARMKDEMGLEDNLRKLDRQTSGQHYVMLAYIASWHYCLVGKNDKAKKLLESSNLSRLISVYDLNIPTQHIQELQTKSQQPPTVVSEPVEEVKVPVVQPTEEPTQPTEETTQPTEETTQPTEEPTQPTEETTQPTEETTEENDTEPMSGEVTEEDMEEEPGTESEE